MGFNKVKVIHVSIASPDQLGDYIDKQKIDADNIISIQEKEISADHNYVYNVFYKDFDESTI